MTLQIPGYRILDTLGKGGMATVYLAEHEIFQRKVALKVMAQGLTEDSSFGERFMREARIVSQLVHPNIVTVYDVGVHEGCYYLSMEYIDGQDLKQARPELELEQKIHIILDIAKALEYAGNKGYVHRDIKPENIMLYAEDKRAVLTDFGIARAAELEISVTRTGTAIGTPHYMSPEQAKGQPVDIRSDIYGLGVVFYLLLVGCVPYDAESAVAIGIKHITDPIPELPEGLEALQPIIDKMMAKLPEDRYQRPVELVEALLTLDVTAVVATAESTQKRAQHALNSASADAPTVVTKAAVAGGRQGRSAGRDQVTGTAIGVDDPTPLMVDAVDQQDDQDSLWPWLAGVLVLLAVVAGVFYSQNSERVEQWWSDGRAMLGGLPSQTGGAENGAVSGADAQANGAGDAVLDLEADAGAIAEIEMTPAVRLRRAILELETEVVENPAQLKPLVEAWYRLEKIEPDTVDAADKAAEAVAREAERIRQLANSGQLEAAAVRFDQLQTLVADLPMDSPAELEVLEEQLERQQQVQQWLEEAREFVEAGALTQPAGANARSRFEQVLSVEPGNVLAQQGLRDIAARLTDQAAEAAKAQHWDEAQRLLQRAQELDPVNEQLQQLQSEVELGSRQERGGEQAQQLIERGEAQLREGAYFTPTENSAYRWFAEALELQPGSQAAQDGISRTIEDFEERLFNLLTQDHIEPVRELLQTAQQQRPNDERLLALEVRVEEAIAEKLLTSRPRVSQLEVVGATGQPAADGAAIVAGRTLTVNFGYENFAGSASVLHAHLMDGSQTLQIAEVPVVLTGASGEKSFRIDRPVEGYPSGRYSVILIYQGQRLASRDFHVQ